LLVWCGAEGYVSGLQDAGLFPHINIIKLNNIYIPPYVPICGM